MDKHHAHSTLTAVRLIYLTILAVFFFYTTPNLGFFARVAYRLHLERAVGSLHHQVKRVILGHHAVALGCRATGNRGWVMRIRLWRGMRRRRRIVASRPCSHGARQLYARGIAALLCTHTGHESIPRARTRAAAATSRSRPHD